MANVKLAIRVGRAVMQDKGRLACARSPDLRVKTHRLPLLEPLWLTLGEIGLHRERSLRQIQCCFIVSHL